MAYDAPPTRILSWLQKCLDADPDFRTMSNRPMVYVFSNGRMFYDPVPLYGSDYITDDSGAMITDDSGAPIFAGDGPGTSTSGTSSGFVFGEGKFGETGF